MICRCAQGTPGLNDRIHYYSLSMQIAGPRLQLRSTLQCSSRPRRILRSEARREGDQIVRRWKGAGMREVGKEYA